MSLYTYMSESSAIYSKIFTSYTTRYLEHTVVFIWKHLKSRRKHLAIMQVLSFYRRFIYLTVIKNY